MCVLSLTMIKVSVRNIYEGYKETFECYKLTFIYAILCIDQLSISAGRFSCLALYLELTKSISSYVYLYYKLLKTNHCCNLHGIYTA